MSNILNNRLNGTLTPAQVTAVKTAFQTILTNMPFLIGLTNEERKSLLSLYVANKVFSEDALTTAINNPTLVPSYINLTSMQNDLTIFNQLDEIMGLANQLCERIDDTRMLAGSEVYQASLTLYNAFGTAANA